MSVADYTATEHLRDGRTIHIRAMRPADREGLLAVFARSSDQTRYRRFFGPKKALSPDELERFLHVDFLSHVALAALVEGSDGQQVLAGGARYVVCEAGSAELAFTVDDRHQHLGIGTHLMRHLVLLAQGAGLQTLTAEVLANNTPMLKLFERAGLQIQIRHHDGIAHVTLGLSHKNPSRDQQSRNVNAAQ